VLDVGVGSPLPASVDSQGGETMGPLGVVEALADFFDLALGLVADFFAAFFADFGSTISYPSFLASLVRSEYRPDAPGGLRFPAAAL
jgi:hypothetical protein